MRFVRAIIFLRRGFTYFSLCSFLWLLFFTIIFYTASLCTYKFIHGVDLPYIMYLFCSSFFFLCISSFFFLLLLLYFFFFFFLLLFSFFYFFCISSFSSSFFFFLLFLLFSSLSFFFFWKKNYVMAIVTREEEDVQVSRSFFEYFAIIEFVFLSILSLTSCTFSFVGPFVLPPADISDVSRDLW